MTAANLANYRAVVFLNSEGDRLNAAQEGALQALRPGWRRLRRHRLRRGGRDRQHVLHRTDRCAPRVRSSTATTSRSSRSATASTPRRVISRWSGRATTSGTVDHAPDGHGPHARPLPRPGAAAGDGTTTGGTDWPISWCRDFQGGRSFYTGMGRTAAAYGQDNLRKHLLGAHPVVRGPRPWRLQGHDHVQLHEHAPDQRRERRPGATPVSRTASRRRPTAGCSTSAARTAARTPSAAR